jgi:hypothetical protein
MPAVFPVREYLKRGTGSALLGNCRDNRVTQRQHHQAPPKQKEGFTFWAADY